MLPRVLEWCADLFAATSRSRGARLLLVPLSLSLAAVVVLPLVTRFGVQALVPAAGMLLFAFFAALRVVSARSDVWKAATLKLDESGQRPKPMTDETLAPPSAVALTRLAHAVDRARRGRLTEASDLVSVVPPELLRADEARLRDAIRASIALSLGDRKRAGLLAVGALPSGSDDLDRQLGRALLRDAWANTARVTAITEGWTKLGVDDGSGSPLVTLQRLVRTRIDTSSIGQMDPKYARVLAEEAEAVGDAELANELVAQSRSFRVYR